MGDTTTLAAFILMSFVLEATPGPNMAYLAALSLSNGWKTGLAAVAGIALGLSIIGIAAALGAAAVIGESAFLYETLRWAGVGYLLWLAFDMWREGDGVASVAVPDSLERMRTAFRRGLVTNLLNPKAAIFYVVVVPTFVTSVQRPITQTLTLTAIYVAVATVVHAVLALMAGAFQPLLASPEKSRIVRRVLALALVLIAGWVAFSTAR